MIAKLGRVLLLVAPPTPARIANGSPR